MTCYFEKDFVIAKMKRWLAAAIALGILFSGAYCVYYNARIRKSLGNGVGTDRLLSSNYTGDYLSYPETVRKAMYDIRIKADVMADLVKNPTFSFQDYVHQYGDVIVERLNSESVRQSMYGHLTDNQGLEKSVFNASQFNDVFGGAFLYSAQSLGVNVTAPFAYQAELGLSGEQMAFIRDVVFESYTSLLDDDALYADLPVYLTRVSPDIEESLSEQDLIHNVLIKSSFESKLGIEFPKKRMIFCFAVGFMLVELIAFMLAARDDRVKSIEELKNRTDLVLISTTTETEMLAYCESIDQEDSKAGEGTAYLYAGLLSADLAERIAAYAKAKCGLREVMIIREDAFPKEWKASNKDTKIVIPIKLMETSFKELEEMAKQFNQYGIEICAIVLQS